MRKILMVDGKKKYGLFVEDYYLISKEMAGSRFLEILVENIYFISYTNFLIVIDFPNI